MLSGVPFTDSPFGILWCVGSRKPRRQNLLYQTPQSTPHTSSRISRTRTARACPSTSCSVTCETASTRTISVRYARFNSSAYVGFSATIIMLGLWLGLGLRGLGPVGMASVGRVAPTRAAGVLNKMLEHDKEGQGAGSRTGSRSRSGFGLWVRLRLGVSTRMG